MVKICLATGWVCAMCLIYKLVQKLTTNLTNKWDVLYTDSWPNV